MKTNMKTPAVAEIYQQKLVYQAHLRKLQKIREERKNQLTFDFARVNKHDEIRHIKSRSFAQRYNEQHQQITQSNIKLLTKLERVRPFTRYTSFSEHQRDDREQQTMTPFRRRRIEQTEKQNSRIYMKMKSVSSSLSKDKLMKDYAKSQQIRTRIARFATQNNKICLKSQKFIPSEKVNLVAHYNAQDILKNKVDNPASKQKKLRPREKNNQEIEQPNSNRIFATEPEKVQQIKNKRKIYI